MDSFLVEFLRVRSVSLRGMNVSESGRRLYIAAVLLLVSGVVAAGCAKESKDTPRQAGSSSATAESLGVSRGEIVSLFTESALEFTFKNEQVIDGVAPYMLGMSKNEMVLLEIIGPSSNIKELSIISTVSRDVLTSTLNALPMAGVLKRVFPDRDDFDEMFVWLNQSIEGNTEASVIRNGILLEYTPYGLLGFIGLEIKSGL